MSNVNNELSRIEKLVRAILGEDIELEPSQSRIETLLYAVLAKVRAGSMDFTAEEIGAVAAQGIASAILNIGDLIYATRTASDGTVKEYAWEIADIGETTVTLQMYRVFSVRNMGAEALYYAENGLEPGWYFITLPPEGNSIMSGLTANPLYFELKQAVPQGGWVTANMLSSRSRTMGGSTFINRTSSSGTIVYRDAGGNIINESEIPWDEGDTLELPEGYTATVEGVSFIETFLWKSELPKIRTVYYDPEGNEVTMSEAYEEQEGGEIEVLRDGYIEEDIYPECTSLGLADGTVTNLNHISRALAGSCEWSSCYLRAWLNSDQPRGSWNWAAEGDFDRQPDPEDGFLYGWEPSFIDAIKTSAHNTIDIGSVRWLTSLTMDVDTVTTEDKVFLPSLEEAGGGLPTGLEGIEGTVLPSSVLFPHVHLTDDSSKGGKARAILTRTPNTFTHTACAIGVDDRTPDGTTVKWGISPCVIVGGDDQ